MLYAIHLYTNARPGDFHSFLVLDPEGELSGGLARPTQCKDLDAAFMATVTVAKNNNNIREVGVHAQFSPRIVCVWPNFSDTLTFLKSLLFYAVCL